MYRTRKVGTITAVGTGETSLTWQANPSGWSENGHVQVFATGTGDTFTSQVFGTMEAARANENALTTAVAGDTIHQSIPLVPYLKVTVDVSVLGDGTFDVWVVE